MKAASIATIESLIRSGQMSEAQLRLNEELPKLKPESLPIWARLARRSGNNDKPLKLLFNKIRKETTDLQPNSVAEIAEYAACLTRFGACEEAFTLLNSLAPDAPSSYPPVAFYWAFLHARDWNYADALKQLKIYAAAPGLDEYDKAIATLNLASCHLALGQTEKAELAVAHLNQCEFETSWVLLQRNIAELQTQLAFKKKDFNTALAIIAKEKDAVSPQSQIAHGDAEENKTRLISYNDLYIKKWHTLVTAFQNPNDPQLSSRFLELRHDAAKMRDWETIRECDYYHGHLTRNKKQLLRVFFGTPFALYRKRILIENPWLEAEIETEYIFKASRQASPTKLLDLKTGKINGEPTAIRPGMILHRLIYRLFSDLFRPLSIGEVFYIASPNQFFDPNSAPLRAHQVIHRLRKWIKKLDLDLDVSERDGYYRARLKEGLAVRYSPEQPAGTPSSESIYIEKLKDHFAKTIFSASEAMESLQVSQSKANRILANAVQEGRIVKIGVSRATRYHFPE